MSVSATPGWIGSSAKAEAGNDWMSGAMRTLGVPVPGWMSQLAGKSKEVHYSIGANHSYNKDTLINYLRSLGSTAVVVTITGDLVSYSSGVPCLEFPGDLPNSSITLVINGGVTVYGRGGNGGVKGGGGAGGNAINNGIGGRLKIFNHGAIAGGGGGGGGNSADGGMGGGGRPFGTANKTHPPAAATSRAATDGTLYAPGIGAQYAFGPEHIFFTGGTGGEVGNAGAAASGRIGTSYGGGPAGWAVAGNSPEWHVVGAIYGSRV